jgi:hypothetical protein
MLHIVMWKWKQANARSGYTSEHVNVMADMIRRNLKGVPFRLVLVTDDPAGVDPGVDIHPLWDDFRDMNNASGAHLPSCYRRLKLFDPKTQEEMGIQAGDRVAWIDLDTVIVGDLAPIFTRKEKFVGWAVRGVKHLRVFNGSLVLFTAGLFSEIWSDFDPETSPKVANRHGFFGSDQSWISFRLVRNPDCAGFSYPQVLSYTRDVRRRPAIQKNASIVFFHGRAKPWHPEVIQESKWIPKYWRRTPQPQPKETAHVAHSTV